MARAECPECGLLFTEEDELREHLSSAHSQHPHFEPSSGGGQKICAACGEAFDTRQALFEHEAQRHR